MSGSGQPARKPDPTATDHSLTARVACSAVRDPINAGSIDALAVVQTQLFADQESLATKARRAGLSVTVVVRLASARRHARLEKILSALSRLGLGLLGRTRGDHHWRVWALPAGELSLPAGATLPAIIRRRLEGCTSIKELSSLSGLGRSVIQRLRRGRLPPVLETILRLMGAVDGELLVMTGDGSARAVQLPVQRESHSDRVPRGVAPRSTRYTSESRSPRGRLRISKAEILTLHQELHWSGARIAQIAGVSAERVRQILRLFGVEPTRVRQRRLRSESLRRRADGLSGSRPGR